MCSSISVPTKIRLSDRKNYLQLCLSYGSIFALLKPRDSFTLKHMEKQIHRIVITGAPGTGKTAVIEALQELGYHIFPEVIREFTAEETALQESPQEATNPIVFAEDSEGFNRRLLRGRQKQYLDGGALEQPLFYDRGLPDVLAYMDYFEQSYTEEFERYCLDHRYDLVFIMPPWESIFHADGGRFETFQQAKELHHSLMSSYERFGYPLIEVPKNTIEKRVAFILEQLNR